MFGYLTAKAQRGIFRIMNHPTDFFQKRSFEVVYAAFRLAAVANRANIRQTLEDRAMAYFCAKDLRSLADLEEIVLLGKHVGDISDINAEVMIREIGVLRDILIKMAAEPKKSSAVHEESIAEIFSKPPISFSDYMNRNDSLEENSPVGEGAAQNSSLSDASQKEISLAINKKEFGNDFDDNNIKNQAKSTLNANLSSSGNSLANSLAKNPEVSGNRVSSRVLENDQSGNDFVSGGKKTSRSGFQAAERREFIISFLRNKTFCHVNEIKDQFPEVSDRTIRYDIKALVDSKIVERVGNGGPNSYFRLKRGQSSQ